MADATKNVDVNIQVKDKTGPGLKKTTQKIKTAATQAGRAASGFVSEQTGRNLSQFNEKTEKGRQLMTAFGGAMGAAGGQVTYYAGTISYVIGRFKMWELATMGIIGGLVAIGAKMLQLANERYNLLIERTNKLVQETDNFTKSIEDMVEAQLFAYVQMSKWDIAEYKNRQKIQALETDLINLQQERSRIAIAAGIYASKATGDIDAQIRKVEDSIRKATDAMDLLEKGERLETLTRGRRERERKTRGAEGGEFWSVFTIDTDQLLSDVNKGIDELMGARQQALVRARELERQYYEDSARVREENENRRLHILQAAADAEKRIRDNAIREERQAAEKRMEYVGMGADAMIGLFQAIATGSAEQISEVLKGMALEALARSAWHGIMAIFSSFFAPWQTGQHATMAALFAGFAATYGAGSIIARGGAGGGGGGGRGGGGGYGATPGGGGYVSERTREEKRYTIIVNGHLINTSPDYDRVFSEGATSYEESQNPGKTWSSFEG